VSDCSTFARRPYQASAYEARILKFMSDNGKTGYDNELLILCTMFDEIVGEAGPGGNHCEDTQRRLDAIDADIKECIQSAVDRYEDWASD
jgi:hypothetical protein